MRSHDQRREGKAVRQISYFRGDGFVPSPFAVPGESRHCAVFFACINLYFVDFIKREKMLDYEWVNSQEEMTPQFIE